MKKIISAFLLPVALVGCSFGKTSSDTQADVPTDEELALSIPEDTDGVVQEEESTGEPWFALGAITAEPGKVANGLAQATFTPDGTYEAILRLNAPIQGELKYLAWLQSPETMQVLPLGVFHSPLGDERHELSFTEQRDLRVFSTVIISIEADSPIYTEPTTILAKGALTSQE